MDSRLARVERYRREAARLNAQAAIVQDPVFREQLLNIARQYEILATSIEMLPPQRSV